jgi:cell division septum initiation protein DivIVA
LENEVIYSQFNDIEEKIDFLIELCKTLEETNSELQNKVEQLEQELQSKSENEDKHAEQKAIIKSKVDVLLEKLNSYSDLT